MGLHICFLNVKTHIPNSDDEDELRELSLGLDHYLLLVYRRIALPYSNEKVWSRLPTTLFKARACSH